MRLLRLQLLLLNKLNMHLQPKWQRHQIQVLVSVGSNPSRCTMHPCWNWHTLLFQKQLHDCVRVQIFLWALTKIKIFVIILLRKLRKEKLFNLIKNKQNSRLDARWLQVQVTKEEHYFKPVQQPARKIKVDIFKNFLL